MSCLSIDFILIAVFPLGITGAALATGISQSIGGFFPIIYFMKKNSSLLNIIPTKLEASPVIRATSNGASEFMTNISSSLESMLFNLQLLKYLGENGVVTYGVLMYAQFIFVAIYFGYTVGISSILITIICRFSSLYLAQLFVGYSKELLEITIKAFSLYCFTFLFFGLNTMTSAFFTALNNGKISACISFVRTLLFQTTCILVLPQLFGPDGIWLSTACAEILALTISIYFLISRKDEYRY